MRRSECVNVARQAAIRHGVSAHLAFSCLFLLRSRATVVIVCSMKTIKRSEVLTKCNTTWCIQRAALDYHGFSHGVMAVSDAASPMLDQLGVTDDFARHGYVKAFGLECEILLVEGSAFAMLNVVGQ